MQRFVIGLQNNYAKPVVIITSILFPGLRIGDCCRIGRVAYAHNSIIGAIVLSKLGTYRFFQGPFIGPWTWCESSGLRFTIHRYG